MNGRLQTWIEDVTDERLAPAPSRLAPGTTHYNELAECDAPDLRPDLDSPTALG